MITHLACVMDGNRRWAKQQGKLPWLGHKAGAKAVEIAIKFCLQHQIPYLSLYTFSLENFNRPQQEQSYLFQLIIDQASLYVSQFCQQGVAIKFVGNLALFPDHVQQACTNLQEQTKQGDKLQVNFLFGYGGRQEIFAATQKVITNVLAGQSFTKDMFESCLWSSGYPDPDLIVRTGGVQRLSNFLLYQAAYAEIRFLDTLWPDLTEQELFATVMSAVQAQKNLGR